MASARGEGSTKAYGEVTTEARGERTKRCAAQHPARNQVLGKFFWVHNVVLLRSPTDIRQHFATNTNGQTLHISYLIYIPPLINILGQMFKVLFKSSLIANDIGVGSKILT